MRSLLLTTIVTVLLPAIAGAAPATAPASASADSPAFRGGGALTGAVADFPAPPYKVRWTYVTSDEDRAGVEGSAAIVGDTVYVADNKGVVHAIDLASGKNRWKYVTDNGFETTPLVHDGKLFIGDLSGVFHAVDAATGKVLWTHDTESQIHSSANTDGQRLVFGNDAGEIIAMSFDGKVLWTNEAGDRVNSCPAIRDGVAYVAGCDATLRAVRMDTGKQVFGAAMPALSGGSPAVLEDRIVVGTDQGHVAAFSPQGKQLWDYDQIGNEAMVYSSPAVADGLVVVGARDRSVHAIDAGTGEAKWTFEARNDVDGSPVISGGRVYIGARDKKLYVLDLKTGKKLWDFTAGRAIGGGAAIGRGVLVITDSAGNVYCLEPTEQ